MRYVGIISDFGVSPYSGIMRAVIKSVGGPEIDVIDLDSSVPNFSITAGAYVTYHTYPWLPKGSVVLVVVDPGVGGPREAVAIEAGDYVFIGPNNGVLYPSVEREGFRKAVKLIYERVVELASKEFRGKLREGRWVVSATFHGRDVFSPAAALIAKGYDLEELGEPMGPNELIKETIRYVKVVDSSYELKVVYVDKFGNVALSAFKEDLNLREGSEAVVGVRDSRRRVKFGRTFSDAPRGELVMYVNSFNHYEVAVNQGNASEELKADVGDHIVLYLK